MNFIVPDLGKFIIPTETHIFHRVGEKPPTAMTAMASFRVATAEPHKVCIVSEFSGCSRVSHGCTSACEGNPLGGSPVLAI